MSRFHFLAFTRSTCMLLYSSTSLPPYLATAAPFYALLSSTPLPTLPLHLDLAMSPTFLPLPDLPTYVYPYLPLRTATRPRP